MKNKRIIPVLLMLFLFSSIFDSSAFAVQQLDTSIPVAVVNSPRNSMSTQVKGKISSIYMVPSEHLDNMTDDEIASYAENIDNKKLVYYYEGYAKEIIDKDGKVSLMLSTKSDYLREIKNSKADVGGWMRFSIGAINKNSTEAEIQTTFWWLNRPRFRMNDGIGASIVNGTFKSGTASGYYVYTTSQGTYQTNYSNSSYSMVNRGITKTQTLAKPDYPVLTDYISMKTTIYKSGRVEGVSAYYAHQTVGITFTPSFSIDFITGQLKLAGGFNIAAYYDQVIDYKSFEWY